MRNLIIAALLAAGVAAPSAAQEAKIINNPDLTLSVGYKLWFNNWASWNFSNSTTGGGQNVTTFNQFGVAHMMPIAFKYKWFFTTLTPLFTSPYEFPEYTDRLGTTAGSAGVSRFKFKVSRTEVDWNVGGYVVQAPAQLGFTAGLKSVSQKWQSSVNGGAFGGDQTWSYIGPTLGITGAAPLGKGFAIYGSGAGGFMSLTVTPDYTTLVHNDTASYETAEMGLAWKAPHAPISATFGYKFQRLNTKLDVPGMENQRGLDLTSGYTMGFNVIF